MLLTIHVIAGAAVGLSIPNPLLSAPISFTTHLLLDAFPHWNYPVPKQRSLRSFWVSFGPDMVATILVSVGLLLWFRTHWAFVVWGIAWAALPDFLTLYQKVKPWKAWLRSYYALHNRLQWEVARGPGLAVQAFFLLVLWLMLQALK